MDRREAIRRVTFVLGGIALAGAARAAGPGGGGESRKEGTAAAAAGAGGGPAGPASGGGPPSARRDYRRYAPALLPTHEGARAARLLHVRGRLHQGAAVHRV